MQDKLSILSVPFQCGCDRNGGQLAPDWLLSNGVELFAKNVNYICKSQDNKYGDKLNGVKNHDSIVKICNEVRNAVVACHTTKERILIIGGDHTIALGSIAGILEINPNVGVIWFDAHGDVNSEATSPSANAHGMPLAALLGLCKSELNTIARVHLNPQNIFWVGTRDLDPGEIDIIEQLGIKDNLYNVERIHTMGMTAVMEDIKKKMDIQKVNALHLSFDIDGMDPSIVKATGTKVENGLTLEDLNMFLEGLKKMPTMDSIDFVEYNPLLDDEDYTTGKWCVDILRTMISN